MKCVIVGPYFPLGETDWKCRTHNIEAELLDPAQFGHPPFRHGDFYCPVGRENGNRIWTAGLWRWCVCGECIRTEQQQELHEKCKRWLQ